MSFEYVDVTKSRDALERMLEFSGGKRSVPVVVEDGQATVGFGGT